MRINSLAGVLLIAAALGCQVGGDAPPRSSQVIQTQCKILQSSGWAAEVVTTQYPVALGFCPIVLHAPNQTVNNGGIIDAHAVNRPGGWVGTAEIWHTGLPGNTRQLKQSTSLSFTQNAPYVDPATNTQPFRATYTLTWTTGVLSSSGQQETDSASFSYPTAVNYNGSFVAATTVKAPVVISSLPGSITGNVSVAPGTTGNWSAFTDWDTSGYKYQWHVDGTPVAGAIGNDFAHAFNHIGTYTVRVDEKLADDAVLSTSKQVTVPFWTYVDGPTIVNPDVQAHYSASAPGADLPYTYAWSLDGTPLSGFGSVSAIDIYPGAPSSTHQLEVWVTDATGHVSLGSTSIFVPANSSGCLEEPCGFNRTPSAPGTVKDTRSRSASPAKRATRSPLP